MLDDLTFEAPIRLWAIGALVLLGVLATVVVRRRAGGADAYAAPALRASVASGASPWWKRAAALVFAAATLLLATGFARPSVEREVEREKAVVVVALDTSTSMQVDDVKPFRFQVAQQTAQEFIRGLPADVDVGLVAFNGSASLVAAPSDDHEQVAMAVGGLEMQGGTAMGDALQLSLQAALSSLRQDGELTEGETPAARVVLLSDGDSVTGSPLEDAVQAAVDAQVPVSTIGLGTETGEGRVFDGREVVAPVNFGLLAQVAETTGGTAYRAADISQLTEVYDDIGSQVVVRTERTDISATFAGVGLGLLALVAVPTLLRSGRLL